VFDDTKAIVAGRRGHGSNYPWLDPAPAWSDGLSPGTGCRYAPSTRAHARHKEGTIMSSVSDVRDRFLRAVEQNDVAAVVACYDPDAVLVVPEGRFEGRDYIEAYYGPQFRAFPDGRLTVLATHDGAAGLVTEWSFSGTHTGPLELPGGQTIPPTGKRVRQRGTDVAVMRDGVIAEHRVYYDQLEPIAQLGRDATIRG
jgi:ketosteroid isomerase-like protein